MKILLSAVLLALAVAVPSVASACRVPFRPESIRGMSADAIVLVQITAVEGTDRNWRAVATPRRTLVGPTIDDPLIYQVPPVAVDCDDWSRPNLGRYYILFLDRLETSITVNRQYQYWWARQSGDPRLAGMNEELPLGPVRQPTAEEVPLIDLVDKWLIEEFPAVDLSRHTRIYTRLLDRVAWLPADEPQQLMIEDAEELPTPESCRCEVMQTFVRP